MALLTPNPLSYVQGGHLFFQYRQGMKRLLLAHPLGTALGAFYLRPFFRPRALPSEQLDLDPEPLVREGILMEAGQAETFLRAERETQIFGRDENLIYLLLAAAKSGFAWWISHDGFSPMVLFAKEGTDQSARPSAAYLFDHYFLGEATQLPSITTPKTVAGSRRRGRWSSPT